MGSIVLYSLFHCDSGKCGNLVKNLLHRYTVGKNPKFILNETKEFDCLDPMQQLQSYSSCRTIASKYMFGFYVNLTKL
jgi:hypothetical protein